MYVRITFLQVNPEMLEQVRTVYTEEVVPVVKQQKGNLGVRLLEPVNAADEFLSITEWETAADAEVYESSGVYHELVNKVKDAYVAKPVLKTYNEVKTAVAAAL